MRTLCGTFLSGNENSLVQAITNISSAEVFNEETEDLLQLVNRLTEEGVLEEDIYYGILISDENPNRNIVYEQEVNDELHLYILT